jgi:hypothetical protein
MDHRHLHSQAQTTLEWQQIAAHLPQLLILILIRLLKTLINLVRQLIKKCKGQKWMDWLMYLLKLAILMSLSSIFGTIHGYCFASITLAFGESVSISLVKKLLLS